VIQSLRPHLHPRSNFLDPGIDLHPDITLAIIQLILLYLQLDSKSVLQFGIVLPSQGVHAVFVCVELLILITVSRSQMIKLLWSHHTTQSQYQMRNHSA
jgi:hypothetical protein